MGMLKDFKIILNDIAWQLKRNADMTEKQNEYLKDLKSTGIANIKFDGTNISVSEKFSYIESNVPTKVQAQDMIEREIEYQKELEKAKTEYPEILELITEITNNYSHMDKYITLDTARMFSYTYKISKTKEM